MRATKRLGRYARHHDGAVAIIGSHTYAHDEERGLMGRMPQAGTASKTVEARPRGQRMTVSAFGLACWAVTLTLYSATITPFQRFAGLGTFVGLFAPEALFFGTMAALAIAIAALRGHVLGNRPLWGIGAVLYLVANLAFATLAVLPPVQLGQTAIAILSLAAGLGSVGVGLAWGRAFKRFEPHSSLATVGLAGIFAALLGTVMAWLPAAACAVLFVGLSAAAAALPQLVGMGSPDVDDDPRSRSEAQPAPSRSAAERLRSFADVAAPALIGLLAFAFVMGTMRALVVEMHPFHLIGLAIDGALLGAFALMRVERPLAGLAYRSLIPALAVLLLTVTNISMALFGGSWLDMAMIYLLYTLAALLTLATLSAVAHAGEFPADFVFGMPFALFCLASLVGLASAEVMSTEAVKVSTTVITAVYAFAMVIVPSIRNQRLANTEPWFLEERDPNDKDGDTPDSAGKEPLRPLAALPELCADLAQAHRLTARETEILNYLAAGYGSGYISEALYISPNTVRTHIHNIYGKLNVRFREDVLDLVKEQGENRR